MGTEKRKESSPPKPKYASYINPHVPQSGEPYEYYIGDIYQRFTSMTAGEWDQKLSCDGPYLQYIKTLSSHGWPQLRYLADFIECSTVPIKRKMLVPEDRQERYNRVHVTVLDYFGQTGFKRKDLSNIEDLRKFLSSTRWDDKKGQIRLFVVEDLSSTVIETLGQHLDVDPGIFRAHINDYQWYNVRDPWFEASMIDSRLSSQSYFTIRLVVPRYLPDPMSIELAKQQAGSFNVLRRIDFDGSGKKWADAKGSDIGLVRCATSLWVRPQNRGEGWLGMLLFDPSITEGFPLWGGYENIRLPPQMAQSNEAKGRPSWNSSFEDFLHWTTRMSPDELAILESDPEYIAFAIYCSIPAQWLLVFEHATTRLLLIEWELENEAWRTPQGLDETMRKLHPWRRRIPFYLNQIQSTTDMLQKRYPSGVSGTSKHWQDALMNFRQLERRHHKLQERLDRVLSVLANTISIEENKKSLSNARDVTRITYLAFVFVPMSFVASFLSMDSSFPDGKNTVYWVYFIIALPLSVLALLMAVYWKQVERLWKKL